jgi:hypothetical protein
MVLKQQQTPVYGNADIWQILLEYEHTGKQPATVTGYRIEWQPGVTAEQLAGTCVPMEVVLFSGDQRKVLDQVSEAPGRRCKCERVLKSTVALQHGELVQVRAKFPCRLPRVQVVLF